MKIEDLEIGTTLICVKDVKTVKGWNGNDILFKKNNVYTVAFKMNPLLEKDTFGIYNPVSLSGHTIVPFDKIKEYFVLYSIEELLKNVQI